ncbi:hypothetical protein [Methanothermococcus okinawensis]|uniref:Uncharacterized protein n=1 Tax=Methanothermococcus okinawensis (strain DSM 14208 / JCM 11175 / IH1) TaxID=647113 RepID=F8AKL9_METOI|nr:hypothetical protein [Methanothermococcus okinawensis]AEH06352.1 hypothetical protein Metok_0363 [Methanothermococcus okinawensis IH1]
MRRVLDRNDRKWLTDFVSCVKESIFSKSKPDEKKALDFYRLSQSFYKKSKESSNKKTAYKNKCVADALYKEYCKLKPKKLKDFMK